MSGHVRYPAQEQAQVNVGAARGHLVDFLRDDFEDVFTPVIPGRLSVLFETR